MNFEIQASSQGNRETSLSALTKVRKHALSKAHTLSVKMMNNRKKLSLRMWWRLTESYMKETEAVFQTASHLAKNNRPFSDHESLIELQELNGIKMASLLHSR